MKFLLLILICSLAFAQPTPQMVEVNELGKQHPYISIVWLQYTNTVTNVVTTTLTVKHFRFIERNPDGTFETNYGIMNPSKTNILYSVTNKLF